jgi:hypothetical protein
MPRKMREPSQTAITMKLLCLDKKKAMPRRKRTPAEDVMAVYIYDKTIEMIQAFTDVQLDSPAIEKILSGDMTGVLGFAPQSHTAHAHCRHLSRIQRLYPDWTNSLLNECVDVDDANGVATVWLTLGVRGVPRDWFDGLAMEGVLITQWRRLCSGHEGRERWKVVRQQVVQGPGMSMEGHFIRPLHHFAGKRILV